MSKSQGSGSRTRSRSASRSRSRSMTRSRSRSRSSSRSRTRKHRYSSRSRSRSRSHSPSHNRERKYQRDNQNNREFRGYNRGFRRPYQFRGRGRGFFRGRFQRGGGYNNYRSNNWKNFRQFPHQKQHQQQYHQQQQLQQAFSPKRGRSRSPTPEKRSKSPQSRSQSRRSDRSSSPHSRHSSSSGSSRQRCGSDKNHIKVVREVLSSPKENQKGGDGGDETLSVQEGKPEADGNTNRDTAIIRHESSPKKAKLPIFSAVVGDHIDRVTSPTPVNSGATSNGSTCWKPVAAAPSSTSPSKKSPTGILSDLGLFANVAQQEEDTVAISIAFRKFLEEQRNKKQSAAENGIEKVADNANALGETSFPSPPSLGKSKPAEPNKKKESEKGKHADSFQADTPNIPLILYNDEEAEEDEDPVPRLMRKKVENAAAESKNKNTLSSRELFEQHISKLEDIDWDDELEAFLLSRKQERAASILAALAKREKIANKCRDLFTERPAQVKRKEKIALSPSSAFAALTRKSSESREPEVFISMSDESPPRPDCKRGTEINLRLETLSEELARSSVLSSDRKDAMDLSPPHINEKEFHPVFQHLLRNNFLRSTSDLFAQHVVAIVHHIKAQYFPSSGMTLNERFALYQRIAAEKEIMKSRKSPEIHRRIDVSPSAFKRHTLLFDELKDSMDSSFKVNGKQPKGDTMDLRLDIEQRKKYLMGELNNKQGVGGDTGGTPESGVERATNKSSKHHKKSKKSKKRRKRSPSSSSSSSSHLSLDEEEDESREEVFSKSKLKFNENSGSMEMGQDGRGFQFKMQGRGWNRVNDPGNPSNGTNNAYVSMHLKNEDWDPERMPKGRKYNVQDEKSGEGERKWAEPRGRGQTCVPRVRGRFILRRPTGSSFTNNCNSNWSNNKIQAHGQDSEHQNNNTDHSHNEQNIG